MLLEIVEVVGVRIPVLALLLVVIHVDEGHARFDQPSSEQQVPAAEIAGDRQLRLLRTLGIVVKRLAGHAMSVAFACRLALLLQVQCLAETP